MPRMTKKMLAVLDKAELRRLLMEALGMSLTDTYRLDEDKLIEWVLENLDTYKDANLSVLHKEAVAKEFRDGVIMYLQQLQDYMNGTRSDAPPWPPEEYSDHSEAAEKKEEDVGFKEREEAKNKKKRGRPRKKKEEPKPEPKEVAKEEEEVVEVEAKEVTEKAPPVKVKFKKVKKETKPEDLEKAVEEEVAEDVAEVAADLEKKISALAVLAVENSKKLDAIIQFIGPIAKSEMSRDTNIMNALVFLVNSLAMDEGVIVKDLTQLPTPDQY